MTTAGRSYAPVPAGKRPGEWRPPHPEAQGKGTARHRPWGPGVTPDRKLEPWESGAVAPFLSIDTEQGAVEVSALGEDRFRITAPGGHEQIVTGYDEAGRTADAPAERFE